MAANPDVEIIEPEDLKEGDERTTQGIITSCRFLSLFTKVAEKAGPDLTNASFAQAAAEIGGFSLPGEEFSSLGPASSTPTTPGAWPRSTRTSVRTATMTP